MTAPASYPTASGAQVHVTTRINAFSQTAHCWTCDGCDGIRGYTTPDVAHAEAAKHAGRCTDKPGGGAR